MPVFSDFVYTGALKQITPLLHFQHDQNRPCLRATTVKPRLDAYILNYLEKKGIPESSVPSSWKETLSEKEKRLRISLRYKLFFWSEESVRPESDIHKLYFGNMGDNSNSVKAIKYPDGAVKFRIVCYMPDTIRLDNQDYTLLQLLKKLFPVFMDLYCFGTRATKGFGSFRVLTDSNRSVELDSSLLPPRCTAVIPVTAVIPEHINRDNMPHTPGSILDAVYVLLGFLKGGFNTKAWNRLHPKHKYVKGYIQLSESKAGYGTEKKFIKQKVFTHNIVSDYNLHASTDHQLVQGAPEPVNGYRFSRSMLGLTKSYLYGKNKIDVTPPAGIERFPNPIRFKPLSDNKLLILVYEIPKVMYEAKFTFEIRPEEPDPPTIQSPKATEFDLLALIHNAINWIKLIQRGKRSPEFDIDDHYISFGMQVLKILNGLTFGQEVK